MTPLDTSELAHYGVLGMKWGVRKDPDRAYSKSIKKLKKIDSAHAKAAERVAKAQKKGLENKAQKLANRSANIERKSVRLQSKSNRLSSKASKYERKAEKYRDKAVRSFSLKKRVKMTQKMENAVNKSYKLSQKSDKLAAKSAKLDMKSRKLDSKSKNLSYEVYKVNYKEKKLQDKGKKWVEQMNKEFANTTLKKVSREDIDYGKRRAVEIASRFDSKAKHSDVVDDIFTGVLAASEDLAHYGVKGMKWGFHLFGKKKDESESQTSGGGGGDDDEGDSFVGADYDDFMKTLTNLGLTDVDVRRGPDGGVSNLNYKGQTYSATTKGLSSIIEIKKRNAKLGRSREKNVVNTPASVNKKAPDTYLLPASGSTVEAAKNSPNYRKTVQDINTRKVGLLKTMANKPAFLNAYLENAGKKKKVKKK